MRRVVIGVPARNEAPNIAAIADRLETGAALLGEVASCELVLAYQDSEDDTLACWQARRHRMPQRVLRGPQGDAGKGANVRLLIEHSLVQSADLLLVDADLRDYPVLNVPRFVAAAYDGRLDLVLPLWSRPWGQANSTNFLAAPLLRAVFGARVRQPLAGQMFLDHRLLKQLDLDGFPADFGIDLAITMSALAHGAPIGQVPLPALEHEGRAGNSERIMFEVATTAFRRLAGSPLPDRSDVSWPDRYWDRLDWPLSPGIPVDFSEIIDRRARTTDERDHWRGRLTADADHVAECWCAELAEAVRQSRSGRDPVQVAGDLIGPFFVHAEYQRRLARPDVADAERYVAYLGDTLAEHVSR